MVKSLTKLAASRPPSPRRNWCGSQSNGERHVRNFRPRPLVAPDRKNLLTASVRPGLGRFHHAHGIEWGTNRPADGCFVLSLLGGTKRLGDELLSEARVRPDSGSGFPALHGSRYHAPCRGRCRRNGNRRHFHALESSEAKQHRLAELRIYRLRPSRRSRTRFTSDLNTPPGRPGRRRNKMGVRRLYLQFQASERLDASGNISGRLGGDNQRGHRARVAPSMD